MIVTSLMRSSSLVLILALLPACGGSGNPAAPRSSVFGAVGASITHLAIQGYEEIGGGRSWPHGPLVAYNGAGIEVWEQQIGQSGSGVWGVFRDRLAADPGTSQIWWHLLVNFRSGPSPATLSRADQELVERVGAEIRRIVGPNLPIYVSPFPDYRPSTNCQEISQTQIDVSKLMAEYAIDQGLALDGPDLRPLTGENNNGAGDPCHQGPLGRQQHGEDLRAFFGG